MVGPLGCAYNCQRILNLDPRRGARLVKTRRVFFLQVTKPDLNLFAARSGESCFCAQMSSYLLGEPKITSRVSHHLLWIHDSIKFIRVHVTQFQGSVFKAEIVVQGIVGNSGRSVIPDDGT